MSSYGLQVLESFGRSVQLLANNNGAQWKVGGVTIDWSTVAAVSGADVTYPDSVVVKIGEKALRFGQVIAEITASGKYGPYDSAASDGRQLLARGRIYLINETVKETDLQSDHPGALAAGTVYKPRLIATAGTHSLTAGPTFAELEAALGYIFYAGQDL